MAICLKRQAPQHVLTPTVDHIYLFVDRGGVPSIKYSDGLVLPLVSTVPGPAGGDLSGVFPNPAVVATPALRTTSGLVLVSDSTAPEGGQVLVASSSSSASWRNLTLGQPQGVAGGDLAGQYPTPIAVSSAGLKISSATVAMSGAAPSPGQVLIATSSTTATWGALTTANMVGPAGGNLTGEYPNPQVTSTPSLKTASNRVSVVQGSAPSLGQMLVTTTDTSTAVAKATWQSPSGDLGGTWSNLAVTRASGLKSVSSTVDLSQSPAPVAGQILTASSSTAATWISEGSYLRHEVLDPPLSPDSADEEFTSDPFLGGSWSVVNTILGAQTRTGGVTPQTTPAIGTYRSTLAGSTVFVQIARGLQVFLMKAVPDPTAGAQLWMAGFGAVAGVTAQAGGPVYSLVVAADLAGSPDFNNRVELAHVNENSNGVTNDLLTLVISGGVVTGGPKFVNNSMGTVGFSGLVIRKGASQLAGTTADSITFGLFGPNGEMSALPSSLTSFSGNWAWAGFRMDANAGSTDAYNQWAGILALHFLRRKLGPQQYIFG